MTNEPMPMALADLWTAYALAGIAAGWSPREAVEVANQMVIFEAQREAAANQGISPAIQEGEERKHR